MRTGSCRAGKFGWTAIAAEVGDPAHRALATGTDDDDREGGPNAPGMLRGVEQGAHGFEAFPGRKAEPTAGADAAEALGQDVLEEAVEEGFAAEGEGALDVSFRFAIAEDDATLVLVEEPLARECGPGDVAGEIA